MTKKVKLELEDLLQRLGAAYGNGYRDGERGTPFLSGYWLNEVSRASSGVADVVDRETDRDMEDA